MEALTFVLACLPVASRTEDNLFLACTLAALLQDIFAAPIGLSPAGMTQSPAKASTLSQQ